MNVVCVPLTLRGLVPLHNACSYGHYEVTELLLKVRNAAFLLASAALCVSWHACYGVAVELRW